MRRRPFRSLALQETLSLFFPVNAMSTLSPMARNLMRESNSHRVQPRAHITSLGCNELWRGFLNLGALILLAASSWAQQSISPAPTQCNNSTQLQMTTATTTQLVALVAGQKVRICAYAMQGSITSTGTTVKL